MINKHALLVARLTWVSHTSFPCVAKGTHDREYKRMCHWAHLLFFSLRVFLSSSPPGMLSFIQLFVVNYIHYFSTLLTITVIKYRPSPSACAFAGWVGDRLRRLWMGCSPTLPPPPGGGVGFCWCSYLSGRLLEFLGCQNLLAFKTLHYSLLCHCVCLSHGCANHVVFN